MVQVWLWQHGAPWKSCPFRGEAVASFSCRLPHRDKLFWCPHPSNIIWKILFKLILVQFLQDGEGHLHQLFMVLIFQVPALAQRTERG